MTSNIGTRQLKDFGRGIGFNTNQDVTDAEYSRSIIQKALNKAFAPEFLNRVDDIVMFDQLSKGSIYKIIDLELKGLYKRIGDLGYNVVLSEPAKNSLPTKDNDVQFGARPLKRAIQKYIEDEMAEMIIRTDMKEGKPFWLILTMKNQKLIMNVKEKVE